MNVRHLLILLTLPLISGCGMLSFFRDEVKPITVQKQAVEKTPLNIPEPKPLTSKDIHWVIITPENSEKVWNKLKEENADLVLFGLTDDGYEQLAIVMAEIRNFIAQQRSIILKYKEYYEPKQEKEKSRE